MAEDSDISEVDGDLGGLVVGFESHDHGGDDGFGYIVGAALG